MLFITRLDHLNVTYFLLDQPKLCHVLQYNERTLRYFEYKQISRKNFNDKIKSDIKFVKYFHLCKTEKAGLWDCPFGRYAKFLKN